MDYLSFVSRDTFGKPAILVDENGSVKDGEPIRVLYVNAGGVAAIDVERVS